MQAESGVIEHPFDVVMSTQQLAWQHAPNGSGHAQVDDERAMREVDQKVFAPSPTGLDNLPLNQIRERVGDRPSHPSFMNQHGFEAMTCCNRVKSSSGCLDFG